MTKHDLTKIAQTGGNFLPAGYQARNAELAAACKETPVPESKPRKKSTGPARPAAAQTYKPNPVWFKPVMFGLMLIGLFWIITFYVSEGQLPVQAWGSWNIVAGFGIAIIGFLMTTRWRS